MTVNNEKKLTKLINNHIPGKIYLASELKTWGISHNLQQHYCRSGWLESIGNGAFKRPNDKISWQDALYSIQNQKQLAIHVGGLTSLSLQGVSHYVRQENENVYLFSDHKVFLPSWFNNYVWASKISHIKTSFLPNDLEIIEFNTGNFNIKISSLERGFIECLYLAPDRVDLVECYHLAEGLVNLRPGVIQKLLLNCSSIKVKRLFLYIAEKLNHQWYQFIDLSDINIGKGHRSIVSHGLYIAKYNMTIPQELVKL